MPFTNSSPPTFASRGEAKSRQARLSSAQFSSTRFLGHPHPYPLRLCLSLAKTIGRITYKPLSGWRPALHSAAPQSLIKSASSLEYVAFGGHCDYRRSLRRLKELTSVTDQDRHSQSNLDPPSKRHHSAKPSAKPASSIRHRHWHWHTGSSRSSAIPTLVSHRGSVTTGKPK